jgi:hypothetical protein
MTNEQLAALLARIARRVDNYKSNSKSALRVASEILAFPEIAEGLAMLEEREKEIDALHAERERLCPTVRPGGAA